MRQEILLTGFGTGVADEHPRRPAAGNIEDNQDGKGDRMDPITLVTSAITLLSPYVAKGAEEFAKELGKDAAPKVKELYAYLKGKFSASSEESQLLSLFEKKPEKYEKALTDVLEERARTDPEFAGELEKHVNGVGPYIKVVQSLKDSDKAVAAEVKKARAGTFDIDQNAVNVKEIIGFKAEESG
ncbi:hypothetical protein [Tunturiibacter lichenicola]|uniref:hypothetical protein n=1 Tax=Tunturiibacter lichenicola TaxID=2051959 RepID=UPI003D9BD7EB